MKRKRLSDSPPAAVGSNSPAGVTIDHRSFPHIIDLIFASLTLPGLVAWSRACTEWRERVRPLLLKHVAIFEDMNCDSIIVRSHDIAWPKHSIVLAVVSTKTRALPQVSSANIVDSFYSDTGHRPAPRSTSSWPAAFYRLLSPRDTEDNAHPRLRMGLLSCTLGWTDVVHFIDYSQGNFLFATDCPRNPFALTLSIDCYSNPASYLESVTSPYPYAFDDLYFSSFKARHYTIIFNNCSDQQAPTNDMPLSAARDEISIVECQNKTLGAACELNLSVGDWDSRIERIAVVGLDDFVAAQDLETYLRGICWAAGKMKGLSSVPQFGPGMPCLGEYLKFYTHKQYRKMIGEERYRLKTIR